MRTDSSTECRELREVLGLFATGITVVTAGGAMPHGMTANAFTSVSLDPPLVLVCVDRDARLHESIVSASSFAVSVLSASQQALARHFANRARPLGMAQFAAAEWDRGPRTGAPLIRKALAHVECALWREYDGGDHHIVLGRVLGAGGTPGDALLFFSGGFQQLPWEP
jgi:flavin reductase (DIM6/NTAB) family NADH-FMN oxidoreductase RutF